MPKSSVVSTDADRGSSKSYKTGSSPRHPAPISDTKNSKSPQPSANASPAAGKAPQQGRTAVPSGMLEAPQQRRYPSRNSPASSIASASHGNLLDTASIASSSVIDDGESEAGFAASRSGADYNRERRPSRHALIQNMLSRSRSTKQDNPNGRNGPKMKTNKERIVNSRSRERREPTIQESLQPAPPSPNTAPLSPHTAPLSPDRGFREAMGEAMGSSARNRSADRGPNVGIENDARVHGPGRFASLMSTSHKAAGDIGRAGKGLMGKFTRSGSTNLREVQPEEHVFTLINRPLIEQVRRTRLRSRLSDAKDKTEFWLPALPYRCIDYLNSKGVEQEGLYRVPGSVRDIKAWQVRFDTELDVNLLDMDEFDDIYTIGSMLKAWLRELPDEIFPLSTQKRIANECEEYTGGTTAPQMLKDELSKLPPFNYYLLFAITAHITLLSKFADVNKMTYQNLCICFQPCINIDAFSFHFLVKDWRNCWQGCLTEKDYLEKESVLLSGSGEASAPTTSPVQPTFGKDALPPSFQLPERPKQSRGNSANSVTKMNPRQRQESDTNGTNMLARSLSQADSVVTSVSGGARTGDDEEGLGQAQVRTPTAPRPEVGVGL